MQSEVFQQQIRGKDCRSGVCLEYLKGTCPKAGTCPFSHALKDFYAHVCKQKSYVCITSCSVSEAIIRGREHVHVHPSQAAAANACKRVYMLRSLVPYLFEDDHEQAEAITCVLV